MESVMNRPEAGPTVLGSVASLAVGAYTDIVSIIAPSEAAPGAIVNIEAQVKNLGTFSFYIAVTDQQDGVDIAMTPDYASVDPGATYSFYGSFTMPSKSVRVYVWSFFWTGTEWYQDDSAYVDIALAVLAPQFQGFGIEDYSTV